MAIKMDKTGIIVCSVVGSLGVLSAIFGFSAEGTKLTPYTILVADDECIYPPNPALALAICAAVFLLVAQITISAVGGCCGCCKSRAIPSETKRIVGIVCAVVSWIAAVIAVVLLGEGASWNANVVRVGPAPFCPYLKDGILAGAGVLTLAATALGITSFIMLRSQPAAEAAAGAPTMPGVQQLQAGIAMGHPQFTPAAAKPSVQPPTAGFAMGQPQYPPKPQGYGQAQVAPTTSPHAQGYAQAPQHQQFHLHLPAQCYGSHAPNQQFPPPQAHQTHRLQAEVASPAAAAASIPGEQPPFAEVPIGHQQFFPPSQEHVQQEPPRAYVQVPVLPSPSQGCEQGTGIRKEDLFKAGAKLLMRVAEHSLSSDNTATQTMTPEDNFLPSMSDSTQDGVQDTNFA